MNRRVAGWYASNIPRYVFRGRIESIHRGACHLFNNTHKPIELVWLLSVPLKPGRTWFDSENRHLLRKGMDPWALHRWMQDCSGSYPVRHDYQHSYFVGKLGKIGETSYK